MDPKEKAAIEKAATEAAQKAHTEELAKRDTELAAVRKELQEVKEHAAKEIAKLAPEKPAPLPADIQKRLDDADAARVAVEKSLASEIEKREQRDAVEKASKLSLGMPVEKLAKVLRLVRKALPEAEAVEVEQALTAVSAQAIEDKKILTEIGRAGVNVDANSPEAQLDALVLKYQKDNPGTSRSVAKMKVTETGEGAALFTKVRKNEHDADKARG